jgi:integrase/recombinase XerD
MRESRTETSADSRKGHFGQRPGTEPPNKGRGRYPGQPLTMAEVRQLLAGCSLRAPTGIRNRAMLTLLVRSGLRVSELLGDDGNGGKRAPRQPLRLADVNLERHSIRLLDTKSGQPQTRGFHPDATDALMRWIDTRKSLGVTSGALFCTLAGEPLSEDYVRGLLRRLAAKAGLEKRVHPHGLRHTYAVELEAAGVPITTISKLLGHSSVAVTARYLDHLTNHQAIVALEAVQLPSLEP